MAFSPFSHFRVYHIHSKLYPFYFISTNFMYIQHPTGQSSKEKPAKQRHLLKNTLQMDFPLIFTEFSTWISFPLKVFVSCSEWRFLLSLRKYNNTRNLIIFTGKLKTLAERDSLHGKVQSVLKQYWTYIKDELYAEILFSNSYVFD